MGSSTGANEVHSPWDRPWDVVKRHSVVAILIHLEPCDCSDATHRLEIALGNLTKGTLFMNEMVRLSAELTHSTIRYVQSHKRVVFGMVVDEPPGVVQNLTIDRPCERC